MKTYTLGIRSRKNTARPHPAGAKRVTSARGIIEPQAWNQFPDLVTALHQRPHLPGIPQRHLSKAFVRKSADAPPLLRQGGKRYSLSSGYVLAESPNFSERLLNSSEPR